MTPPLSHRSKLLHDIRNLSGIDLTKMKVQAMITISGVLFSAVGTGAVLSWQAGSRWTTFELAQTERDKKIAIAIGKVQSHDGALVELKVRQDGFDKYCCAGASAHTVGLFDVMTLATIPPQRTK